MLVKARCVPSSGRTSAARETRWHATDLPVWYLAQELGGWFAHIKEGTVDVTVDDRWRLAEIAEIDSRWKLVLRNVRAEVPEGLTPLQRVGYSPWIRVLNSMGDIPLTFGLKFDGTRLTTYGSADSEGVWQQVGSAMIDKLLGVKKK